MDLMFKGCLCNPNPPKAIVLLTIPGEAFIERVATESVILVKLPFSDIWGG